MISIAAAAALCYGQWRVRDFYVRATIANIVHVAKGVCRCGQGVAAPKSWHENILTFQNFGRFFFFCYRIALLQTVNREHKLWRLSTHAERHFATLE